MAHIKVIVGALLACAICAHAFPAGEGEAPVIRPLPGAFLSASTSVPASGINGLATPPSRVQRESSPSKESEEESDESSEKPLSVKSTSAPRNNREATTASSGSLNPLGQRATTKQDNRREATTASSGSFNPLGQRATTKQDNRRDVTTESTGFHAIVPLGGARPSTEAPRNRRDTPAVQKQTLPASLSAASSTEAPHSSNKRDEEAVSSSSVRPGAKPAPEPTAAPANKNRREEATSARPLAKPADASSTLAPKSRRETDDDDDHESATPSSESAFQERRPTLIPRPQIFNRGTTNAPNNGLSASASASSSASVSTSAPQRQTWFPRPSFLRPTTAAISNINPQQGSVSVAPVQQPTRATLIPRPPFLRPATTTAPTNNQASGVNNGGPIPSVGSNSGSNGFNNQGGSGSLPGNSNPGSNGFNNQGGSGSIPATGPNSQSSGFGRPPVNQGPFNQSPSGTRFRRQASQGSVSTLQGSSFSSSRPDVHHEQTFFQVQPSVSGQPQGFVAGSSFIDTSTNPQSQTFGFSTGTSGVKIQPGNGGTSVSSVSASSGGSSFHTKRETENASGSEESNEEAEEENPQAPDEE